MFKKSSFCITCLSTMVLLLSCFHDDNGVDRRSFYIDFLFEEDEQGWEGGFAEYVAGEEDFFELSFSHDTLPETISGARKGLRLSGTNRSDDLFMFIKTKIDSLKPNTLYAIRFDMRIASNAPEDSFGIGGSPGGSVYLKAGATLEEPVIDEKTQLNIDKGNQASGGEDMQVLGNIGTEEDDFVYTIIKRDNFDTPFYITTDEKGSLWTIVGTDSGFEGTTTLYYDAIRIIFEEYN